MTEKIRIFGIDIDVLGRKEAVHKVCEWLKEGSRTCKYVVTPNVDHVVKLQGSNEFRHAYERAALVLADGRPVVASARLFGSPLPETVPGSDLVPAIFDHVSDQWKREISVYLLGAAQGVAERAEQIIHSKWQRVSIVGTYSPPMGFQNDENECAEICNRISESGAELLVIGLGAPKQELWVSQYSPKLPVKVALCVGATIDFLAEEKARAPSWMRRAGLEWLHRMASEPRRLAGRYFHDAAVFPFLVFREWRSRRVGAK